MIHTPEDRRTMFKVCLTVAGISGKDWAKQRNLSYPYLTTILRGMVHEEVDALIDGFIRDTLPQVKSLTARASSSYLKAA